MRVSRLMMGMCRHYGVQRTRDQRLAYRAKGVKATGISACARLKRRWMKFPAADCADHPDPLACRTRGRDCVMFESRLPSPPRIYETATGTPAVMDFHKPRYTPMSRRRRIYEGKAKVLYEGPEPGTLIQHFKDDATAFNAKKHEVIDGKGVLNNRIS